MDALWPAAALTGSLLFLGLSVATLLAVVRAPAFEDEEAQFPAPTETAGSAR